MSDQMKGKIVDSAYRLIKAQSFEATSIKQICEEAGVAYSTFYSYFPSKESVIVTLFAEKTLLQPEDFPQMLAIDGAWDRLWKAIAISTDKICELGPDICANMLIGRLKNTGPDPHFLWENHRNVFVPLIKNAQEKGEILNTQEPEQLFTPFLAFTVGYSYWWALRKGDLDLHAERRKGCEMIFQVRDDLRLF